MFHPDLPRTAVRLLRTVCILAGLALLPASIVSAGETWRPVPAADLAAKPPANEADAAAVVLLREITVDARLYGEEERTEEYLRVKIFDPERATSFTRISEMWSGSSERKPDIVARLTLPNGTVTEFGPDQAEERNAAKRGVAESKLERWLLGDQGSVREWFLAIKGVVPGAIVEIRKRRVIPGTITFNVWSLQSSEAPVKQATLRYRRPSAAKVFPQIYLLNASAGQGEVRDEKSSEYIVASARDLPSFPEEPMSGSENERLVSVMLSIADLDQGFALRNLTKGVKVDVKRDGEWSPIASRDYLRDADTLQADAGARKLAKEITVANPDPAARARAIYERVEAEYDAFSRRKIDRQERRVGVVDTPDEVLRWRELHNSTNIPETSFHYLALVLFREAGLEAHTVRIAGRKVLRFRHNLPEEATVPRRAIAVKLGNDWRYCMIVKKRPLPFGWLTWEMEGEVALLAKTGKEEFIGVPYHHASESTVVTAGDLTLAENGDLSGTLTRTYTGHSAITLRERIWTLPDAKQREKLHALIRDDFGSAEITVDKVEHAEECTKPLVLTLGFRIPSFAVATETRLLIRPQAAQFGARPPFSSEKRRGPVLFPFPWMESDRLTLHLPPGWKPEALPNSRPLKQGDFLGYAARMQFDPAQNTLSVRREFAVKDWLFEVDQYPALKRWFDAVVDADQQEIAFVR